MKLRILGVLALAAAAGACDEPLNPTPQQNIPTAEALDSPDEIRTAVNGMYDALQNCDGGYCRDLILFPDLYGGNLSFTGTYSSDREVSRRQVTASNSALPGLWGTAYSGIDRANNVLTALPALQGEIPAGEYARLAAEARFVRALNYHNLVKFFGGVPIVTTPITVAPANTGQARNTEAEVYAFIEQDLTAAIPALPLAASTSREYQGHATSGAARSLLARVYLYQRKWQQAYDLANAVIVSGQYALQADYAGVFTREQTSESVFEVPFTVTDPGSLAFWFYTSALGGRRGIAPSSALLATLSTSDRRRAVAVQFDAEGTSYGNKYEDISSTADDVPVIRLAELYLIRAEAAARLGNLAQARADVDVIRNRAGLASLDATAVNTQTLVLQAVLNERRRELFFEGHWFFDLKRFGDQAFAATLLTSLGVTEQRLLFPLPQREIDANPALTQNPGY
jgi:hypothetical protein